MKLNRTVVLSLHLKRRLRFAIDDVLFRSVVCPYPVAVGFFRCSSSADGFIRLLSRFKSAYIMKHFVPGDMPHAARSSLDMGRGFPLQWLWRDIRLPCTLFITHSGREWGVSWTATTVSCTTTGNTIWSTPLDYNYMPKRSRLPTTHPLNVG